MRADSALRQLGLRSGDVVVGAFGERFGSLSEVMALAERLDHAPTVPLSVVRRGRPLELEVKLVGPAR